MTNRWKPWTLLAAGGALCLAGAGAAKADHPAVRESDRCSRSGGEHARLFRDLRSEHDRWHRRNDDDRGERSYWHAHERLHNEMEARHVRWHQRNGGGNGRRDVDFTQLHEYRDRQYDERRERERRELQRSRERDRERERRERERERERRRRENRRDRDRD
uniref:Uncharacterized protein n=1 Tax=uncultured Armatimonadetes bacterium TaxID=157466 RepID=A0A6J4HF04_9BACT|nr:hypothetical protein AVDCRST_MAG63-571 [uncultured Armatimonadetes bacterium]